MRKLVMRKFMCEVALVGFMLSLSYIAKAQYIPGTVDMMPSMNATTTNAITAARTRILAGNSASGETANRAVEQRGTAKIKAGKATTHFVSMLAGTQGAVKNLNFDPQLGEPQDLQGQIRYVQGYVKRFDALMVKYGFAPNDQADFDAMVYILIYKAKYDQEADPQRVDSIRQDSRQTILNSPVNQGLPDTLKQSNYETYATVALQAYDYRNKVRNASNSAESRNAEYKAVQFADDVLKFYKKENRRK